MGRDCASEHVPITLAEGPTRGPPAESPALTAAFGQKTAAAGSAGVPTTWKAQKAALGHRRPAERASCERQRPGGATVVISIPCQRLVVQRLPWLP
jgi:hypothetical protein